MLSNSCSRPRRSQYLIVLPENNFLKFSREICDVTLQNNPYYINFSRDEIYEHVPLLREYLVNLGIEEKMWRVMFTTKKPPEQRFRKISSIHIDAVNKHFTHSINIPIVDCENTYTLWYKGVVRLLDQTLNPHIGNNDKPMENFAIVEDHEAKEICRVETVRPMIINTTIPHRGWSMKPSRVLCCIRFKPDLTEEEFDRILAYNV